MTAPGTFDALLREAAARVPAAVMAPQRVDFAALDALADHYCARLREGLARENDAAVLIAAPTAQSVAAIVGALRAGLALSIAPPEIHGRDLDGAVLAAEAAVLAGPARYAGLAIGDLMCRVAVDQERVSLVATHGGEISGVLGLDGARDSYARFEPRSAGAPIQFIASRLGPAARFDESDLIAAARETVERAEIHPGDVVLTTLSPASAAGLAAGPLAALAAGARLVFHAPFDSRAFVGALDAAAPAHLILPEALVSAFRASGVLDDGRAASVIVAGADDADAPALDEAFGRAPVVAVRVGPWGGIRVGSPAPPLRAAQGGGKG